MRLSSVIEANASNHWTRSLALKLGGKLPPSNSFALQNATYTTASSTTTFSSSPSFLIREFTGQNGLDTDLRPNFQQQQLNIVAHSTRCLRNPSCFAISAHFELIGLTQSGLQICVPQSVGDQLQSIPRSQSGLDRPHPFVIV